MRRLAPFLVLAFVLAGCGGVETVSPTAETVVGTVAADDSSSRGQGCEGRRHALHEPGLRRLPHVQAGRHERHRRARPGQAHRVRADREPGLARGVHAGVDRQPERLHREGLSGTRCPTSAQTLSAQADRRPRRVPDQKRRVDRPQSRAGRSRPRAARDRAKGGAEAFDELLAADDRWRELVPQVDELRGRQKLKGKPTPEQVEELKAVKEDLRRLEEELSAAEAARDELLQSVPNPAHESVPDDAQDDSEGEIVREVGERPQLDEPKEHLELGPLRDGARRAPLRLPLRLHRRRHRRVSRSRSTAGRSTAPSPQGFTPVIPPVLVREEAMYGTGFFPAERFEIYEVADEGLYLTGTSEVALAGLHMGEILDRDELPLRYTAFSTNFRREAGAAGRDTRGMFRVHQFNKVELFALRAARGVVGRARAAARDRGVARAGARPPYRVVNIEAERAERRRGQALRHRGVVPVTAALPRADLGLEHDRLPVAPPRHPLPRERRHRVRAHAQRHRRHRPLGTGRARELPGRGARGAAAVRRPGPDRVVSSLGSRPGRGCRKAVERGGL